MKNGGGINVAAYVVVALLGALLYVLGGYKAETAEVKAEVKEVERAASDREARLRVLEAAIPRIDQNMLDIKKSLDRHMQVPPSSK